MKCKFCNKVLRTKSDIFICKNCCKTNNYVTYLGDSIVIFNKAEGDIKSVVYFGGIMSLIADCKVQVSIETDELLINPINFESKFDKYLIFQ